MQVNSRLVHPAHGGDGAEVQRDKVVAVLTFNLLLRANRREA